MTRKSATVVVIILLLVAIPVVHILQQKSDSNAFDAIQQGDSKENVVAALGRPDEIRACQDALASAGERLGPKKCVEEFYYSSMPGGWSVGFSADGKVVDKFAYVSP